MAHQAGSTKPTTNKPSSKRSTDARGEKPNSKGKGKAPIAEEEDNEHGGDNEENGSDDDDDDEEEEEAEEEEDDDDDDDELAEIDPRAILPSRRRNRAKVDYTSEEALKKAGLDKDDLDKDDLDKDDDALEG